MHCGGCVIKPVRFVSLLVEHVQWSKKKKKGIRMKFDPPTENLRTDQQGARDNPSAIDMTSNVDSTKPRTFNPEGVWAPPPTYNQVAITPLLPSSRLITLAGMTGCDPARTDNPRTVREQAPVAYENIRKALAAAGATPRDIVQVS